MSNLTRRDLLRATVASAAVVPAVGLRGSLVAANDSRGDRPDADDTYDPAGLSADGPVMVVVSDAEHGDVSILHGTSETVVRDRRLVAKIMRAGAGAPKD